MKHYYSLMSCKTVARVSMLAASFLFAGNLFTLNAQDSGDSSDDSSDFTSDLGINGNIPTGIGFHLPGVRGALINSEATADDGDEDNANGFYITLGGKIVYQSFEDADQFDGVRADVSVTTGVRFSALDVRAKLNLQRLLTKALEDDFEARGYTNYDGLAEVRAKNMLEEAVVALSVVSFGEGKDAATVKVFAGRDQVMPTAEFLMDTQVGISLLESAKLDQTEQIGVAIESNNLTLKLAAFGQSVLPYWGDGSSDFDIAEDNNDGFGSFAASLAYTGEDVEAYIGWASLEDFINLNDPTNTVMNGDQISAGALWKASEKFRVSTEFVYYNPDDNSVAQELAARFGADYQLFERLSIGGRFEARDSDDATRDGNIASLIFGYKVADNSILAIEISQIDPRDGDKGYAFGLSYSVAGDSETVHYLNERETTSEPNAQAAIAAAKK